MAHQFSLKKIFKGSIVRFIISEMILFLWKPVSQASQQKEKLEVDLGKFTKSPALQASNKMIMMIWLDCAALICTLSAPLWICAVANDTM